MTAAHAIDAGTAPIAVRFIRGDEVESVHRAHVAVVDADGTLRAQFGDPHVRVYPRSSLKPLFASTLLRHGFQPAKMQHLAMAASSHSGEGFHRETVAEMLGVVGLSTESLANTPDWPYDPTAREAWIAAGGEKSRVTANCSGKHASLLSTCVAQGWPTTGYLEADHPLRETLAAGLAELTGTVLSPPAIDGCGAPVWAVPLDALARGYSTLTAHPAEAASGRVGEAMRTYPEYVGGSRREVTDLMRVIPGLVAKDGADGIYGVGLPDGGGLALKIEDGSTRAMPAGIAAALVALGYSADDLEPVFTFEKVKGGGRPAGRIDAVIDLEEV